MGDPTIADLKQEIQRLIGVVEKLQAENKTLNERILELTGECTQLKTQEVEYQKHLHDARFNEAKQQFEMETLKGKHATLKRDYDGLHKENEDLRQRLSNLETNNAKLECEVMERDDRISKLETTNDSIMATLAGLKSQIAVIPTLQANITVLQSNFIFVKSQLGTIDENFDEREMCTSVETTILRTAIGAPTHYTTLKELLETGQDTLNVRHHEARQLMTTALAQHPWLGALAQYRALFKSVKMPANKFAHANRPKNRPAAYKALLQQIQSSQNLYEKDMFIKWLDQNCKS